VSYEGYKSINTGDYTNYVKYLLSAINGSEVNITKIFLAKCPPLCKFNVGRSINKLYEKEVTIQIDNPYAVPILLAVNNSTINRISNVFSANKFIIIDYTTQVSIVFDDALHLVTFPLVPFSDVTPRYIYVEQSLNLTLSVKAPTIAGFLSPLATVVSVLAGIVSALGIVKYYTRTPVADIINFPKLKILRVILLILIFFVVILLFYFPHILPQLLHILSNISSYYTFLLSLMLLYPPYYVMAKIMLLNTMPWRSLTVALMEAYDISIILWGLQWLMNPFVVISSPSLILTPSIALISILAAIIIMFYLIISMFHLKISEKSKIISMTAMLVILIPFLLNAEIIARRELCTMATTAILKVRLYLENNSYVEGFVAKCSLDKIVIDNGRERRVFSWNDIWQIEFIR